MAPRHSNIEYTSMLACRLGDKPPFFNVLFLSMSLLKCANSQEKAPYHTPLIRNVRIDTPSNHERILILSNNCCGATLMRANSDR